MRVAVISGRSSISEALAAMLRRSGHEPAAVPDTATALKFFGRRPPDVIVCHLCGETLAHLAEWLATIPEVPVFVMVDRMEPTTTSAARVLGAHSILTRPISQRQLCQLMREVDPHAA